MCQDIKIQEDGELENESVQNVLKQPLIVRKVLECLDFPTLVQCRAVSKSWEKESTFILGKKCKITFKDIHAVQEFSDLSLLAEMHFVHVNFNFEIDSEGSSTGLQIFLKNHAKHLSSVDTPSDTIQGSDSVEAWVEKLLNCSPALVEQSKDPDQPAVLDENANYVQLADESNLQEVVIHEEPEDNKLKQLASPRKGKSVHFTMVANPDYVPIPYCDEGYETFADFYPYYLGEHSHETGRRLHVLGITNCLILIIIGTFTLTPILYVVAVIQAYALAIGAHLYFDRHFPRPTVRNPIYMTMGNMKLWWEVATGQRAL